MNFFRSEMLCGRKESELRNMPLSELEDIIAQGNNEYARLLDIKNNLENTFNNDSLDATTRDNAAQELFSMQVPFSEFENEHVRNLSVLKSRLSDHILEEQESSNTTPNLR